MAQDRAANDDSAVSLEEAILLLDEIERLRSQLEETERRLAELDSLAHKDPLVDLPNRRRFVADLDRTILSVRQKGHSAAIIFADVDGLKAINDKFGHDSGDKVLMEVSRLLVASVRHDDCVARLAGDEFAILLQHVDELSAWQMALRVVETVDRKRLMLRGEPVALSVAVGAAVIRPTDTPDSVLARADREMYRIKGLRPIPGRS
jgi:diguanylate cyclase (GGDEF)-like protein